jgi:hypothetical protein
MIIEAWTDYPITELGDIPNELAPVRPCTALAWDGDKYVICLVEGVHKEIKWGYIYIAEGRCGEVLPIDPNDLEEKSLEFCDGARAAAVEKEIVRFHDLAKKYGWEPDGDLCALDFLEDLIERLEEE